MCAQMYEYTHIHTEFSMLTCFIVADLESDLLTLSRAEIHKDEVKKFSLVYNYM